MVTFKALRVIHGDYGTKQPGEIFTVQDFEAKELESLEARGIIMRHRPRLDRKAYTVVENKAVVATDNKGIVRKTEDAPIDVDVMLDRKKDKR